MGKDKNRDLSQEREARDAALAKTIAKAVAREMAKTHAQYQALLNDRSAAIIPTSLKVTSGANGFKVMVHGPYSAFEHGPCLCHDLKEILRVTNFLLYLSNMIATIVAQELRF